MSSLTRIPLDSANVDIFSGLTKSVLKFYVSEDIVNSVYEFPQHPDKPIALVESEKTAIICSGLMPQYLWLATGGKSHLSQEKQNGELIPGTPRKVQLNDSNDIEILLEKWFFSEYFPEIHNLINDFDLTPVTEEWLI